MIRRAACAAALVLLATTAAACEDDVDQPVGRAKEVPCGSLNQDSGELFMYVDAHKSQVADVRRGLIRSDGIFQFCFLSKEDAYREFRRLFADQPDLVESVSPDDLPVSFRITLVEGSDPEEFKRAFETRAGVDDIILASDAPF